MTGFRKELDRLRGVGAGVRDTARIREQLGWLREPSTMPRRRAPEEREEALPSGRVLDTRLGSFYSVRTRYPLDHFHGRVRLGRFAPDDLSVLLGLAGCDPELSGRERVVFLDTETTGVHGGVGMCPFLVGVGFFDEDGFEVLQYFIRDFDEEPAMLAALGSLLAGFDLIVTYNGRAFDLPLVENRCVIARLERPFGHLTHLDLLFTARRLWRAGHGSCRLTALEQRLAGFARGPDIPGARIPRAYFDFLQHGDGRLLGAVFSHNVYDILSLAALTVLASDRVTTEPAPLDDALDVFSLGRVLERAQDSAGSVRCYEIALRAGLPSGFEKRALERLSVLYRRAGEHGRSLECCQRLIDGEELSLRGYEGAAAHYERRERDLSRACGILVEAIERIRHQPGMERRLARLESRLARLRKMSEAQRRSLSPTMRSRAFS